MKKRTSPNGMKVKLSQSPRAEISVTRTSGGELPSWTLGPIFLAPSFVMFANLVKAFDTSNYKLVVEIFSKCGCPPKLRFAIRWMYADSKVRLVLGEADISISFEVSVKQGNSVTPVLFHNPPEESLVTRASHSPTEPSSESFACSTSMTEPLHSRHAVNWRLEQISYITTLLASASRCTLDPALTPRKLSVFSSPLLTTSNYLPSRLLPFHPTPLLSFRLSSLRNGYNAKAIISNASAAMGAFNPF